MINQSSPVPSSFAPTIVMPRSGTTSAIHLILGITAILVAILLGLIVLLLIGVETGPVALLIGLISATLPVPLYVVLVLWIDRYEAEPLWMLLTAFFWGALIAVFFAFLINTASGVLVYALTDSMEAGHAFGAVISAPIVEECAKAVILFIFFFAKKDEFDGVVDGIVYASMVGLGFAMTENIQYYGRAVLQGGGGGLTVLFIIRGMMAPFSHPLFTSMTGIGLGLARQSGNTIVKFLAPIVGLLAAIFMHGIWNGSALMGGGLVFLLTYFLIMVPAFFITLAVVFVALRREGRVVRQFLLADFECGILTQQEYDQLCSVRGRMGASFNSFSRGGVGTWRACMRFNQMASELAFHRCRVARGILPKREQAHEREAAYLRALQELQKHLRPS